jgi:hypothetical protein
MCYKEVNKREERRKENIPGKEKTNGHYLKRRKKLRNKRRHTLKLSVLN